jgi:hypothetical protein
MPRSSEALLGRSSAGCTIGGRTDLVGRAPAQKYDTLVVIVDNAPTKRCG